MKKTSLALAFVGAFGFCNGMTSPEKDALREQQVALAALYSQSPCGANRLMHEEATESTQEIKSPISPRRQFYS